VPVWYSKKTTFRVPGLFPAFARGVWEGNLEKTAAASMRIRYSTVTGFFFASGTVFGMSALLGSGIPVWAPSVFACELRSPVSEVFIYSSKVAVAVSVSAKGDTVMQSKNAYTKSIESDLIFIISRSIHHSAWKLLYIQHIQYMYWFHHKGLYRTMKHMVCTRVQYRFQNRKVLL
jgi:hypothetical protein